MDARAALFEGLVDYAGLFPPAALDLPTALRSYDAHVRSKEARLLGRFVLPAARLLELEPWLQGPWLPERPLRLSLLAALEHLPAVAQAMATQPSLQIEALELRLPETALPEQWLDELRESLIANQLQGLEVYVELAATRDQALLAALGKRQSVPPARRLGAKLRCGGVTADLVPPVTRIAAVIIGARDHGVPLKFTAGLHHPLRGMDHIESVPMHGFLNVYGAGLLAHVDGNDAATLIPVLEETDPAAFRIDAAGFAWRDRVVPTMRIVDLRDRLFGGYGSCSFDDPVTDLRSLALLP